MPRYRGTLYGGAEGAEAAPAVSTDPENTGSLTGHILAQGRTDEPPQTRSITTRLVLGLLIGLGILVTSALLVIAGVGGVLGTLINGLLVR